MLGNCVSHQALSRQHAFSSPHTFPAFHAAENERASLSSPSVKSCYRPSPSGLSVIFQIGVMKLRECSCIVLCLMATSCHCWLKEAGGFMLKVRSPLQHGQKHNNFTVREFHNRCACFLSPSEELSVIDQSIMIMMMLIVVNMVFRPWTMKLW